MTKTDLQRERDLLASDVDRLMDENAQLKYRLERAERDVRVVETSFDLLRIVHEVRPFIAEYIQRSKKYHRSYGMKWRWPTSEAVKLSSMVDMAIAKSRGEKI